MPVTPTPTARDGYVRGNPSSGVFNRQSVTLLIGISLTVLLVLSQLGENGVVSWFKLRAAQKELRAEVAALEDENRALRERLDALQKDPWALEKLAREKYNMLGPGEEVLMVVSPSGSSK